MYHFWDNIDAAIAKDDCNILKSALLNHEGDRLDIARMCVANNAIQCLEWLLKQGFDVNSQTDSRMSCLHAAMSDSNQTITRLLLDYGANPNLKYKRLILRPLDYACCASEAIVLFEYGAKFIGEHFPFVYDVWDEIEKRVKCCKRGVCAFLLASKRTRWHKDVICLIVKTVWEARRLYKI